MGAGEQVRAKEFSRKQVLSVLLVFVTPVDKQWMRMTVSLICWAAGCVEGKKRMSAN